MTVPPMLVLAFLFASLVVSVSRRFATVLKVSIYIPTIISSVIASIVFVLIYTYDGGILNAVLAVFHIDPVAWIGIPRGRCPWRCPRCGLGMGITSLIMVAAMVDIPTEYYEAGDGGRRLVAEDLLHHDAPDEERVPLPADHRLRRRDPAVRAALVMTQGGPLDSTTLPNLFIFNHFPQRRERGRLIAAALLLFVVLGSVPRRSSSSSSTPKGSSTDECDLLDHRPGDHPDRPGRKGPPLFTAPHGVTGWAILVGKAFVGLLFLVAALFLSRLMVIAGFKAKTEVLSTRRSSSSPRCGTGTTTQDPR